MKKKKMLVGFGQPASLITCANTWDASHECSPVIVLIDDL